MRHLKVVVVGASIVIASCALAGCSKEEGKGGAASASANEKEKTPPPASTSAAAAPSAAPEPKHDCPKGSSGEGSQGKPCEAKGNARMMEIAWTGKTDENGPGFNIKGKSDLTILYGKIAVYFYDKAGKQLQFQDTSSTPPKAMPYKTCSGNIFGGAVKKDEKFVVTFSCVKKEHVPEGTTAIEAEAVMVGFADATEKKNDFYWSNPELAPEQRKKGGVK